MAGSKAGLLHSVASAVCKLLAIALRHGEIGLPEAGMRLRDGYIVSCLN